MKVARPILVAVSFLGLAGISAMGAELADSRKLVSKPFPGSNVTASPFSSAQLTLAAASRMPAAVTLNEGAPPSEQKSQVITALQPDLSTLYSSSADGSDFKNLQIQFGDPHLSQR